MISPILTVLTSVVPMAPEPSVIPEWIDFYGNMRLRLEHTLDQPGDTDRTRGRMRFRAGARFQISDDLRAEVRMSTASGVANNPHWDMGGSNGTDTVSGADLVIDRINLAWVASDSVTLVAGKMGNPLKANPVYGEWIWDGDIQPAGIAGIWEAGGDFDFDVRLAHFIYDEENGGVGATADPAMTILQVNLGDDTDSFDWDISSSLWSWSSESSIAPVGFGPDYLVWDTVLSAQVDELIGSVEFIQNLDDDTGDDTGLAFGAKYGAGGKQGASQFSASFFDFDANASLWSVGQDDVPISASAADGLSGFVAGWRYWYRDNVTLRVWAIQGDDGTDDPMRLRFDIDVNLAR
ncbi:MAG: putative porin [Planctomycetota bacterium]|nr:putative porin [Planctomycetota bacterium]